MREFDWQIAIKTLHKCQTKDRKFARNYRLKQQTLGKAQFFQRYSDYYKNLIDLIMTTNKVFDAQILAIENRPKGRFLHFLNLNSGTEGWMPEISIINYVVLPSDVVDAEGHVLNGVTLKLREKEAGIYYPAFCYKRRTSPIAKGVTVKKMNRDSLYDDVKLYQEITLTDLWQQFAYKCIQNQIDASVLLNAINMKGVSSEEDQYNYLCSILNIDTMNIGMQENRSREYKSSFLHSANPIRSERSHQYQTIFKEIAAFGNSHIEGSIFVGIANDGSICGVETELLNEAPFSNRSDFQADFRNQMNQVLGNYCFTSSIQMEWYKTEDNKLFCRILVPKWEGGVILMNGCELYVREDAGKKQLKNSDLINYILEHRLEKVA